MSTNLVEIKSFLGLYPATKQTGKKYNLSTHHIRVILIIHYLSETHGNVTRALIAKHSYLWLKVVHSNVRHLIELGYIEPLKKPRNFVVLTPLGLSIIDNILIEYSKALSILHNGPPILNKPKPRKK